MVVQDCSELQALARLARWDVDCVQAGRGPLHASLAVAAWGSLTFTDQLCNRALLSHGALGAGMLSVVVPEPAGERLVVNGRALDDSSAIVARGDEEGLFVAPSDVRILSVTLPAALVDGAANGHAAPPRHSAAEPRVVRFPAADLRLVRAVIGAAFSRGREREDARVMAIRRAEIEEWLARTLIRSLYGDGHGADPTPRRSNRVAYVRQACDYVEAHRGDVVRLADLAGVVGVSIRTLEYAFRDVVGMGPLAYARIRRLNMARRSLLAGRSVAVSVSDVAIDHGFGHLGYFARDYKALFGELPRETLARGAPRAS